jgi:hypothetical protein
MSERASIFDDEFDVSGFAPRQEGREGGTPPEVVRAVSEAAQFRSREPARQTPPVEGPSALPRREPRRYRTGRNTQLNVKVRAETLDSFYALADEKGWVLGETLERALAALRKNLAAEDRAAERVKKGD